MLYQLSYTPKAGAVVWPIRTEIKTAFAAVANHLR